MSLNVRTVIGCTANDAATSSIGTVANRTNVSAVVERYAGQPGAADILFARAFAVAASATAGMTEVNKPADSFGRVYTFSRWSFVSITNTGTTTLTLVFQISTTADSINSQITLRPNATFALQTGLADDGYMLTEGWNIEITNQSTVTAGAYTTILSGKGTRV